MQIIDPCGFVVEPDRIHRNSRIAATRASRILGRDWRERGYTIRPAPIPAAPRTAEPPIFEEEPFL